MMNWEELSWMIPCTIGSIVLWPVWIVAFRDIVRGKIDVDDNDLPWIVAVWLFVLFVLGVDIYGWLHFFGAAQ
jgi:hypothetical protein